MADARDSFPRDAQRAKVYAAEEFVDQQHRRPRDTEHGSRLHHIDIDPDDPAKGLLFRGRIAEDFKLATGTWVHVGPLRAAFIEHFAPLVRDVVIAGDRRNEPAALVFLAAPAPREELVRRLRSFAARSTGSSNRIARLMVLEEPPSLDAGEMTEKGTINQRAVLTHRAALIEELYAGSPRVLAA